MAERTLIDSGAIVALLVSRDAHHEWARRTWAMFEPPVLTCEAVLSEAQFLVARFGGNPQAVLEFIVRGAIRIEFELQNEVARVLQLQETYRNLGMSLADACLVSMSERKPRCRVVTTDSHFRIYRRNRRQQIPLIMPG